MVSPSQLRAVCPKADPAWAEALSAAMAEFSIGAPVRASAFLAQLAHESAGLTRFSENLNYSAERLVAMWPKRFTPALAAKYARQPEKIANYAYAGRYANGDESSGDGWRYRGRGPIQLTFRGNYRAAGEKLGLDLVNNPDRVLEPAIGARVAGWYWDSRKLNVLADARDFVGITKAINGGTHGLADRTALYEKAKRALAVAA